MTAISPTQSNIQAALGAFLTAVLPATGGDGNPVSVVVAVDNRVPEPAGTDFVVMSPLRFRRLATNVDSSADVRFTGSIAGTVMTVSDVSFGTIRIGASVFGVGVTVPTTISSQTSGTPGGVGAYVVSSSQTVGSEVLSAGQKVAMQEVECVIQCDFHSGNDTTAADMAQITSTLLRDEFGVDFFAALAPPLNGVVPLYADDPRMIPFQNENQQWERRAVLEVNLQIDQSSLIPQQYADAVSVTVESVEATFPP